jgi:hypothetical protein
MADLFPLRAAWIGWTLLTLLPVEALPQARVGQTRDASLAQQKASVRKQSAAPAAAESFFVLPPFLQPPPQSLGASEPSAAPDCPALPETELKALAAEAAHAAGIRPE